MNTATKPRFTYNDIYETIREYHWMIRELDRLKRTLDIDSRIAYETKRKRQKVKLTERFEQRTDFVQSRLRMLNMKEQAVVRCYMDGMSREEIAKHLDTNTRSIYRIQEKAVQKLFDSQNEGEGT